MQSVDVIIPVYGRVDMLEQCIAHLPKKTEGYTMQVFVVDDGSSIDDWHKIQALCEPLGIRRFRGNENRGFPYTVNRGVTKSQSKLIFVLNDDVMLRENTLDVLVNEMDDPAIGIASPMLLFPEGTPYGPAGKIQHIGMAYNLFGLPFHLFIGWDPSNPRANKRRVGLSCVTGACFLTRRSIWDKIGGFSEVYGRGTFEDAEYCLITKSLGHKIVVNPEAVAEHFVGQSSAAQNIGFDLRQNEHIFKARMSQLIRHDEYLFW